MAFMVGSASVDLVPDGTQWRRRVDAITKGVTAKVALDIDDRAARAKIDGLSRGSSATVNVDADTAAAAAKIDEVARDRRANVKVDVDQRGLGAATANVSGLVGAVVGLGPALIPIAAVSAAAFGAIGAGALAAGAGVGALILGFSGVGAAVKAMGEAQANAGADAAKAAKAQAAAAAQIASARSGLAGAEAALKNARASAADAAVTSAARVADAQRGVQQAEREAADAAVTAAQRTADARRGVADATRTASQGVQAALAQVQTSERALATAQQASQAAQESLTRARLDAKRALEDLNFQVQDGVLAERQANLSIAEAKKNLDALGPSAIQIERAMSTLATAQERYAKTSINPKATAAQKEAAKVAVDSAQAQLDALKSSQGGTTLQRQQAQLAYDQALQNLAEIRSQNQRLAAEKADADKKGIAGSTQVVAAQQQIKATSQGVADAQKNVADSEAKVAEARRSGAESVAKAQEALATAQRAQVKSQEDGAARIASAQREVTSALQAQDSSQRSSSASIAQAQRGVADAQRALQQALTATGTSGSASVEKLHAALAALSPEGQRFAKFLFGLKPQLDKLKSTAQAGLLPGVEAGIKHLLPLMPTFNKIIGIAAGALGGMAKQAGIALGSPLFKTFFDYVAKTAGPNLKIFGQVIGGIARGFAGLVLAFAPVTKIVLKGIGELATKFGDFGANAGKKGSGFQGFLSFVQENLPKVVGFFGDLFKAVPPLLKAFAPLGVVVLAVADALLRFIGAATPGQLAALAAGIGGIGLAIAVAMDANPIGLIITSLALLATGLAYAWKHSQTFRDIVIGVFGAVKKAGKAAIDWLTGAISATVTFIKKHWVTILVGLLAGPVGLAALAIKKHWSDITGFFSAAKDWVVGAFKRAWSATKGVITGPLSDAVNAVRGFFGPQGPIRTALRNVLDWFRHDFKWSTVYDVLTSPITRSADYVYRLFGKGGRLRTAFSDAVTAIGKIWAGVQNAVKAPIKFVVETVLNGGLIAGFNTIGGFLHLPKIPNIPLPKGFSTGGTIPGYAPGRDTVHALLSPGEGILVPEAVRGIGGERGVNELNRRYSSRVPRFSTGGVITKPTVSGRQNPTYPGHSGIDFFGRVGDAILAATNSRITYTGSGRGYGDAIFATAANGLKMVYGHTSAILAKVGQIVQAGQRIGSVGYSGNVRPPGPAGAHLHFEIAPDGKFNLASNRAATESWLAGANVSHITGGGLLGKLFSKFPNPLNAIKSLGSAAIGKLGKFGSSPFMDMIKAVPSKLLGGIVGQIKSAVGGVFGGTSSSAGVSQWAGTIKDAMARTGMPASTFDNWMAQVKTESGGNPRAVQGNIGDINNRTGDLAKGLLQVIGATFSRYHDPALGNDVFNPLQNAVAAMLYARSRYGLSGIERVIGHGRGYANGTTSAKPGWAWVGERGPELMRFGGGERVLDHRTSVASATMPTRGGDTFVVADVETALRKRDAHDRNNVTMANLRAVGI